MYIANIRVDNRDAFSTDKWRYYADKLDPLRQRLVAGGDDL